MAGVSHRKSAVAARAPRNYHSDCGVAHDYGIINHNELEQRQLRNEGRQFNFRFGQVMQLSVIAAWLGAGQFLRLGVVAENPKATTPGALSKGHCPDHPSQGVLNSPTVSNTESAPTAPNQKCARVACCLGGRWGSAEWVRYSNAAPKIGRIQIRSDPGYNALWR